VVRHHSVVDRIVFEHFFQGSQRPVLILSLDLQKLEYVGLVLVLNHVLLAYQLLAHAGIVLDDLRQELEHQLLQSFLPRVLLVILILVEGLEGLVKI